MKSDSHQFAQRSLGEWWVMPSAPGPSSNGRTEASDGTATQVSSAIRGDFSSRVIIEFAADALAAGFSNGPDSAHNSKTIMVPELRALLAATSPSATLADYGVAAVNEDAMRKATIATRQ